MSRPIFSRDEWSVVAGWGRAIAAGALILVAAWLAIALVSYDPADPGVFSATWRSAGNWAGDAGAWTADALRRTLGVAAWATPTFVTVWAVWIWSGLTPPAPVRRTFAAPVATAALAMFASAHAVAPIDPSGAPAAGHGGLIGDYLFRVLASATHLTNEKLTLIASTLLALAAAGPLALYALGASRVGVWRVARRAFAHMRALFEMAAGGAAAAAVAARRAPARRRKESRPPPPDFGLSESPLARPPSAPRGGVEFDDDGFGSAPSRRGGWSALRNQEPGFSSDFATGRFSARMDDRDEAALDGAFADIERRGDVDELDQRSAAAGVEDDAAGHPSSRMLRAEDRSSDLDPTSLEEPDEASSAFPDLRGRRAGPSLEEALDDQRAPTLEVIDPLEPEDEAIAPEPAARADAAIDASASLVALLDPPSRDGGPLLTEAALAARADQLERVLGEFGVKGEIIDVNPGPVVTQFELEPAPGLKAARVIGLADDIARTMSATAARISTIPGRSVIGVELPNEQRERVNLRALLEDDALAADAALPLILGKDIAGAPVAADLARMPHLLIAGTTGSGKSVAINTMILSLLARRSPEELRLVLVDPKMLELSVYNDLPHLLAPVVTDPRKAVAGLKWVVREMERRYERMARLGVRSLESYNERARAAAAEGKPLERRVRIGFDDDTGQPLYETECFDAKPLPKIVVVIDEMADLMLVAGKEIEHCIQRLAQMARASGIHLIMATQRPSVDVITGVIKANFPIRISFQVTSKIDSRTILGEGGAEQLLGKGDMLFTAGGGRLQRIHGPFVSDEEVAAVASHLRRSGPPDGLVSFGEDERGGGDGDDHEATDATTEGRDDDEALYDRAVAAVRSEGRASTSFVQRRLKIGYNRAARLIEMMEADGVVSAPNRMGKRELLAEPMEKEAS